MFVILSQFALLAQNKEIVAYYPEWSPALNHYYIKNIQTAGAADKITVLNFAFVQPGPDSSGNIIAKFMNPYLDYQQIYSAGSSVDGTLDDSTQLLRGSFNQLKKLKAIHPQLKIIISIGGWTGSTWFSDAALTSQSREKFVNNCIDQFIYGNLPSSNNAGGIGVAAGIFDGFDIDWEFPSSGGCEGIHHNKNDRENLSELIILFRKKLDELKSGFLLTSAVPSGGNDLRKFDLIKDQASIDWFNVMTYGFHGSWNDRADHHANLFSIRSDAIFQNTKESLAGSVLFLIDSIGVKPNKIIPGAAFYGVGWKVAGTFNNGLHQPVITTQSVSESGFKSYNDLSSFMNIGYEYHWDNNAMAPWLFNSIDSTFWSFDDPASVALKTRFVYEHNLRGLMFWDISGDDFACTLVNTIYFRNMPDTKNQKTLVGKKFPLIKITTPSISKNIHAGSDVIINAKKIKINAPIVKVEFFVDNSSIGYNTKDPFSWVWFNVSKGKHKLKAVATDNDGNRKLSKELSIYIKK